MMSLGQKAIAFGVILAMNVGAFLITPVLGILALFASAPLAFVILRR